jgi:hypothetical protein
MDLDDELRRLFTSDRLDVAVRPDADEVIVAGARRLRTRRILTATAGGAAAIVAVVVAGIVLAGGNPDAMPPATTNPSTPSAATSHGFATPTTQSTAAAPPVGTIAPGSTTTETPPTTTTTTTDPAPPDLDLPEIGPYGFQALRLGQTLEEAQATGMIADRPHDGGCVAYTLVSDGVSGQVYISDTVQAIAADPVMTPEGVGPGWTIEQVQEVYSVDVGPNGQVLVPVLGNASASYRLQFADGVVTSVGLQFDGQTCY